MCHTSFRKNKEARITLDRIDNSLGHIESNMLITCNTCNRARKVKSIYLQEYENKIREFSTTKEYMDKLLCVNGEENKKLFYLMRKKGIVGGPSMVISQISWSW